MNPEVWKYIPGYYPYQVSSFGKVKGKYDKELRISQNNFGYLKVNLQKDGKSKTFKVHRLIASAFLGLDLDWKGYHDSLCVCHKDDNPLNNRLDNLFLGTQKDNVHDCLKKGREPCPKKAITQYSMNGIFIKHWQSATQISHELGFNRGNISSCCNGKCKSIKGFIWKYTIL